MSALRKDTDSRAMAKIEGYREDEQEIRNRPSLQEFKMEELVL